MKNPGGGRSRTNATTVNGFAVLKLNKSVTAIFQSNRQRNQETEKGRKQKSPEVKSEDDSDDEMARQARETLKRSFDPNLPIDLTWSSGEEDKGQIVQAMSRRKDLIRGKLKMDSRSTR